MMAEVSVTHLIKLEVVLLLCLEMAEMELKLKVPQENQVQEVLAVVVLLQVDSLLEVEVI
jgi:hypothetical protein